MRRRDWFVIGVAFAALLALMFGGPVHAAELPVKPAPHVQTDLTIKDPPRHGEVIVKVPWALPDNFPYASLPRDLKLRLKDPRAWA